MDTHSDFSYDEDDDLVYDILDTVDEKRMHFVKKNINNESFKKNLLPYTLLLNFNYTKRQKNYMLKWK